MVTPLAIEPLIEGTESVFELANLAIVHPNLDYVASIDWGDGLVTDGVGEIVLDDEGNALVTGSYLYVDDDVYTVFHDHRKLFVEAKQNISMRF